MLVLKLSAPFAACRPMSAGWYRAASTMITPTAAYGLILNVAAVESRCTEEDENHSDNVASSVLRNDLPQVRLAIGVPATAAFPTVQSVYQQLHNYPVGKDAGMPMEMAMGTKNNISPVRREFLSQVNVLLIVDGKEELEERVRQGLRGEFNSQRYGLPFLGDNQFLVDKIQVLEQAPAAKWYVPLDEDDEAGPKPHTTRLTTWISRTDMSQTKSVLFAPTEQAVNEAPAEAFVSIPPGPNYPV